jgi:hypothetical protein
VIESIDVTEARSIGAKQSLDYMKWSLESLETFVVARSSYAVFERTQRSLLFVCLYGKRVPVLHGTQ